MSKSPDDRARRVPGGRYTPRLDTLGQMHVNALSAQIPVTMREISLGGFSVESTAGFSTGTTHRFRFSFEGGGEVEALAECVYSKRVVVAGPLPLHLAGFEFVPVSEESSAAVAGLVYRIAELWDYQE